MIIRCLLLVLFLTTLLTFSGAAQKFLALDKGGRVKRVRFYVDDKIKVRMAGSHKWIGGEINYINDTVVDIDNVLLPISQIKAIRCKITRSGTHLLQQAAVKLPIAGAGILGIAAFNSAINNTYPIYSPGLLISAGALIASGPIAYACLFRQYRVTKRHQIKILDVSLN